MKESIGMFEYLGLAGVWCDCFEGNEKSKRVQEKPGFRYQRTLKDVPVPQLGEIRREYISRITKEEWQTKG